MALIIFDYDGVLADTLNDLLQSGQVACNRLGVQHRVTKKDISELEVMSFSTFGQACGVPEPLVDQFVEICLNYFAEKGSPPALFEGLSEVIRHLAAGHTIAVITTNSSKNVRAFLVEHGLDDLVNAVYGIDTPGTKAQKISIVRERLQKDGTHDSVFMVGDSLSDVLAAKEAGATSIAVTWGHQSLDKLMRGDPDHVVHSPRDLIEIIVQ